MNNKLYQIIFNLPLLDTENKEESIH